MRSGKQLNKAEAEIREKSKQENRANSETLKKYEKKLHVHVDANVKRDSKSVHR